MELRRWKCRDEALGGAEEVESPEKRLWDGAEGMKSPEMMLRRWSLPRRGFGMELWDEVSRDEAVGWSSGGEAPEIGLVLELRR